MSVTQSLVEHWGVGARKFKPHGSVSLFPHADASRLFYILLGPNEFTRPLLIVQEYGDAEIIEGDMARVLSLLARLTSTVLIAFNLFHVESADECTILEELLFTGTEAVVPLDLESGRGDNLAGSPPVPQVFKTKTLEEADATMKSLIQIMLRARGGGGNPREEPCFCG